MVQRGQRYDAAVKDVQMQLSREECASGMEQRRSTKDAAMTDVQTKPSAEECALGMGHNTKDAAVKDVQIKPSVEECVKGTGLIAIHKNKMNLLHLDQNFNSLLQLKP